MHLQARDAGHEPRSVEDALAIVVPQHVADVLTEEALDALAELDGAVDVLLLHAPGFATREVLFARCEGRDFLVDLVVPAHVGDQVADQRKRLHGAHAELVAVLRDRALAHQAREAVDLGRIRSIVIALPGAHGGVSQVRHGARYLAAAGAGLQLLTEARGAPWRSISRP